MSTPLGHRVGEPRLAPDEGVEAMKARIYELNRMSEEIHKERSELASRIAEALAVWKIGQRVLWRQRGEYEITAIRAGVGVGNVEYIGRKVLKSGQLGAVQNLWGYKALAPSGSEQQHTQENP